jgi:hypothetical protein
MNREKNVITNWLTFFVIALFVSGLTAIPVEKELSLLVKYFPFEGSIKGRFLEVLLAIRHTGKDYPFLFYGYDWLAFAHFVLAILFIGPLRNPVKNKWVIEFGIAACLLVIPFALIAGHFREIPLWWRLIDCSFGILGLIPLMICLKNIKKLEQEEKDDSNKKESFDLLVA